MFIHILYFLYSVQSNLSAVDLGGGNVAPEEGPHRRLLLDLISPKNWTSQLVFLKQFSI